MTSSPLEKRSDSYWLVFVAIILLALMLRAWNLFSLGLDHYDEGVYALSGFWSLHGYAGHAMYPLQKLFSPPVYFWLIGLAYRITGSASDSAAIAVDIIVGASTAALAGWIGSRWFGRGCGMAVVVLVAFSNFLITFDRTALTDTLFSFLFLLTLAVIAIALEKNSLQWALVAGILGGLAWNVKYEGWLPSAVAITGIVALTIAGREQQSDFKRRLLLCGIVAAVSLFLYLPWVIYTQERLGGYLPVEAFHKTFYSLAWWANFLQQAQNQIYLDGVLSHIAPIAAFVLVLVTDEEGALARWRFVGIALSVLVISSLVLGGIGTCLALGIVGLSTAWKRGKTLGALLICGIALLLVMTPFYTVYARLLLPWALLVLIMAGVGVQTIVRQANLLSRQAEATGDDERKGRQISGAFCLIAVVVAAFLANQFSTIKVDPWNSASTDSVRRVVATMATVIPAGSVVFVEGEPDAAFYFQRAGYTTFCIMHLLNDDGVPAPIAYPTSAPVYLVAGVYAQLQLDWNSVPKEMLPRLSPVARFVTHPGDVRLLDDFSYRDAKTYRLHPDDRYGLLLIRVNPS